MVHAYCEIRDSWTGWLRGSAMSRTLHERIVPEMRALRDVERRIVDQPSVTLLAVLDYAARARQAVPAYTPLATIDHPQPPVPDTVREACERMIAEAEKAALAARRAGAREYAARMAYAIEREREEEARRRRAMKEAGVTETPAEAEAAAARVDARIAVYQREIGRVYEEADLGPDGKPTGSGRAGRRAGTSRAGRRAGASRAGRRAGAGRAGRRAGAGRAGRRAGAGRANGRRTVARCGRAHHRLASPRAPVGQNDPDTDAGDRAALRRAAGADRPGQARRHAARLRWGRSE